MYPDANPHVALVQGGQIRVELFDRRKHVEPGPDRAKCRTLWLLDTEERHQPIPHVSVDVPAVATNRLANVMEIAVQHMNDIVGQHSFGERREATDVCEENGK